jgi:hypothetical protein
MGLFNFSSSTQNQISSDAATINRTMREIIQLLDSDYISNSVKINASNKLSYIETESRRIMNNINSLSHSQQLNTKIPWMNGETMNAQQWLLMFSMMMNEVAQALES